MIRLLFFGVLGRGEVLNWHEMWRKRCDVLNYIEYVVLNWVEWQTRFILSWLLLIRTKDFSLAWFGSSFLGFTIFLDYFMLFLLISYFVLLANSIFYELHDYVIPLCRRSTRINLGYWRMKQANFSTMVSLRVHSQQPTTYWCCRERSLLLFLRALGMHMLCAFVSLL